MSANRRHPRNWDFFSRYSWYLPGVGGMFMLLALLLVGTVLGSLLSGIFTLSMGEAGMEYAMLISYPVMFIPPMIYAGVKSSHQRYNNAGLKIDSSNFDPLGGLLCALVVMVGTVASSFCSDALISLLPEMPESLEKLLKSMTTGTVWVNFLCVSIFAPFFEEWLCRGMVLRGLLGNGMKPVWAIVVSAVFFAFIHMNPWQAVPAFLLGCLFGFVYYKTGSLKLTMLMHFTNNTFALVCSHIPGFEEMDSWMDVLPGMQYWCIFGCTLALIALALKTLCRIKPENPQGNMDSVPSLFEE